MPVQADVRFHCSAWDPRHSADDVPTLRWRLESVAFLLQHPCTQVLVAQPVRGGRDTGIVGPSCMARNSSTSRRSWSKVQISGARGGSGRRRSRGDGGLKAAKSEIFMIDEVRPDGRAGLPAPSGSRSSLRCCAVLRCASAALASLCEPREVPGLKEAPEILIFIDEEKDSFVKSSVHGT